MTSKEALSELLDNATSDYSGFIRTMEHYAHIVEEDLDVLDILRKHLYITVDEKPSFDARYAVSFQRDKKDECDYTIIFVDEEEKEILKRWLENE